VKAIKSEVQIRGIRALADRGISFICHSPELTASEKALFFDLQNEVCDILIVPKDAPNAPEVKISGELENKSQGTRIRNVLYVYWKQNKPTDEFEDFYKQQTEKFIEFWKDKLE